MKQLFKIEVSLIKSGSYLSSEHFLTSHQNKSSFFHNSFRKNLFVSASYCWDSSITLRELEQKFWQGGEIGDGDLYLDFVLCYFKIFRLHAILPEAAGAVRLQTGRGPGYCPHDWLRSKLLPAWPRDWTIILSLRKNLPTLYFQFNWLLKQYVFIVLDIELIEKNINKELGLFWLFSYKDFHFVNQRVISLINRQHITQVFHMELRGVVESWIMISSLLSFTKKK